MSVLFTAACPHCGTDARWMQRRMAGDSAAVTPAHFEVLCPTCDTQALTTTPPVPAALPPVAPLLLRGYRWVRRAVA
jgi:endogenous inhibitor of DNA gyrase (YacG/DUF329 family)